jgi:hypothetical protein
LSVNIPKTQERLNLDASLVPNVIKVLDILDIEAVIKKILGKKKQFYNKAALDLFEKTCKETSKVSHFNRLLSGW